jgi:hypothetical protein
MIAEIEFAAKSNRPKPRYVPKLTELDPGLLAWDGNATKRRRKKVKGAGLRKSSSLTLDSSSTNNDKSTRSSKTISTNNTFGTDPMMQSSPSKSAMLSHQNSFASAASCKSNSVASLMTTSADSADTAQKDRDPSPNHRQSSNRHVNVNVLGCLKSVELVLAQAEQRSRHMKVGFNLMSLESFDKRFRSLHFTDESRYQRKDVR